jgi:hypothetical protein
MDFEALSRYGYKLSILSILKLSRLNLTENTPLRLLDLWILPQVQATNFVHDGFCRELEPVDPRDRNILYKLIVFYFVLCLLCASYEIIVCVKGLCPKRVIVFNNSVRG